MLEALGLDRQTEAVYQLILTDHSMGVAELVRRLGLKNSDVCSALERLANLKLLNRSAQDRKLQPVSPALGLRDLLNQQKRDLQRRQEAVARCEADLTALISTYSKMYGGRALHIPERLDGIEAVQHRLAQLAKAATTECMTFNPGGAQSAESLKASKPLDQATIGRGVRMRTVYLDSVRRHAATSEYAEWLTRLGGEVRTVPSLPLRMLIVDHETVIVPTDPNNTRVGATQLTEPGVVVGLSALFEHVWASAVPLGARQERDDGGLTRQEQELLSLLGQGLTDEAAGKRLGVSLRTVRRMMADLMQRLEAHSRFEAGLRAAERQWL